MGEPARKRPPATYADLCALPETVVGEILGGDLFATPRPAGPHAVASSAASATLGPPFQFGDGGPGGWWILFEPELHLGEDVLVPDLAGWRTERMPHPPKDAFFTLAPDWIAEVLSPGTANLDRVRKMPLYARAGVSHAWLIDPLERTLEAYRLGADGHWVLLGAHGNDARVRVEPFEAIEVDLLRFWGERRGS